MSEQSIVRFTAPSKAGRAVDEPIVIGKDVLELVTGAMYVDPLCIYREYVQNACDAIDDYERICATSENWQPRIDVEVDANDRSIRVRDNGIGVSEREFVGRLVAIGASVKRGTESRGFRGVGRLAGLGYCQELVFRSRATSGDAALEVVWNGRKLKELLREPGNQSNLEDAIRAVAEIRILNSSSYPAHFFEVELRKIARLSNDSLLNEESVRAYLSQVAPLPFDPDFKLGRDIVNILREQGVHKSYAVYVGGQQLFRPFRDKFSVTDSVSDAFQSVRKVSFTNMEGEIGAVGWVLDHSYLGAIPRKQLIGGLRIRIGDIQIGGTDILATHFPEARFNAWCVGEIHVLDRRISPNGRRDDFEPNTHYYNFVGQISPLLRDLTKMIRGRSSIRQVARAAQILSDKADEALALALKRNAPPYLISFAERRVSSAISEIKEALLISQITRDDRKQLEKRLAILGESLAKLSRRGKKEGAMTAKRKAYSELLELIYVHSSNTKEAHRLAERIVRELKMV